MGFRLQIRLAVTLCLSVGAAFSQTQVDLARQGKNVDFSGAGSTKPAKAGISLPATCSVGEMFFKTDAPGGQNLYGCTSTDVWTLNSGAVTSVFGRTGAVAAAPSDYDAAQIDNTPAGNLSATDVQGAINELDTEKAAASHTHPGSEVDDGGASSSHALFSGGAFDAGFRAIADADLPDSIARDAEINIQGTANEIASSGAGVAPVLSIAADLDLTGKNTTKPMKSGTTLPAACSAGEFFFDVDATPPCNVFVCADVDNWENVGCDGTSATFSERINFSTVTQGGTASTPFSLPATNFPALTDSSAGGFLVGSLAFDQATDESVQTRLLDLTAWTGGQINVTFTWFTAATTGDVTWAARSACIAAGEGIGDLAWNATSIIVSTAAGVANDWTAAVVSNLSMTNCAAQEKVLFEFFRDADATETGASDTVAADANLVNVLVTIPKDL